MGEHTFKHSFQDLNPIFRCCTDVESCLHFFLHCLKTKDLSSWALLRIMTVNCWTIVICAKHKFLSLGIHRWMLLLTHPFLMYFRPMFHLCIKQVVGFYKQNVWKTPMAEWNFFWQTANVFFSALTIFYQNLFCILFSFILIFLRALYLGFLFFLLFFYLFILFYLLYFSFSWHLVIVFLNYNCMWKLTLCYIIY